MNIKDIFAQNNLAIQETPYTCGPASLLNVLRLKGGASYTEEELAKLCDAKPGIGTSNDTLIKVAQEIGLEVVEAKQNATIEELERHIDNGAYVIVCYQYVYSDEGHYAVLTEYDDESLYFRDPASGFLKLKKRYFSKFWYGGNDASKNSKQWFMAVK